MIDEYGYIHCDECDNVDEDVWATDLDCYNTDCCVNCLAEKFKDLPRGADALVVSVRYQHYENAKPERQVWIKGRWVHI